MSRLTDLIAKVKRTDPQLGADLEAEVQTIANRRAFGLNFERHAPEAVELPGRPVRKGNKVRVLAPRGSSAKGDPSIYRVAEIKEGEAVLTCTSSRSQRSEGQESPLAFEEERREGEGSGVRVPVSDLVVVAEFDDLIYPGLARTGSVHRGGGKPCHTVINGENYHVLKALTYTHRAKVDAIYIDPPYNSGARDWKYNNNYVEEDDQYRHSKWLAMMERRLLIAKELLNPVNSVLIATIDEREYLRLGLLLGQVFHGADIQMVSSVINRSGSPRAGRFARVDEYLFFVFLGTGAVQPWTSTMLEDEPRKKRKKMPTVWFTAIRTGSGATREKSKSLFYPVIIHKSTGAFIRVGDPVAKGVDRESVPLGETELAIWPLAVGGRENRWRFSAELMRKYFAEGTARLGKRDSNSGLRPVTYLRPGTLKNIDNGTFQIAGRTEEGALEIKLADGSNKPVAPRSVWSLSSHYARDYGSYIVNYLLPGRTFPFPKSLYAVEDTLRFFVATKPNAVVLDFFAGSGTTGHAVMRLNRQDDGNRQCIMVTNNEVSADEHEVLCDKGLRPGDLKWEKLGICEHITKPRVKAAITGKTPDGEPIKGEYKFTDEFPISEGFDENAEFFTLTYETPIEVDYGKSFESIAPLLWLRAGAQGRCIETIPEQGWDIAETYGILERLDQRDDYIAGLARAEGVRIAYIVSDDDKTFQSISQELPEGMEAVRLYESYVTNFEFTTGDKA